MPGAVLSGEFWNGRVVYGWRGYVRRSVAWCCEVKPGPVKYGAKRFGEVW